MIRVLVAEDSPTARALIVGVLDADPEVKVIAEARTGAEAVELASRLRPDLITMDIEMPLMDGLEAARRIMQQTPIPIVVVSSSTNRADADRSLDAIATGALSVIDKPEHPLSPRFDEWCALLLGTVKAMAHVKVVRRFPRRAAEGAPPDGTPVRLPPTREVRIVAIAASTGGPAVLSRILRALPADFPVPILVVQHIAPGFAGALARWLNDNCAPRVQVAVDGEKLRGGRVYIAPDDRHLGVVRGMVALLDAPAIGGFRPSANHLFESAARAYGAALVAVILTGMGNDGADGLLHVRAAGGRVLAQDEESCVVYGMPREAVRTGAVDAALGPAAIAHQLLLMTGSVQRVG